MRRTLPPVRSRVSLRRESPARGASAFARVLPGRTVHLYDSGSAALAVALRDACLRHGSARPEVILPAYGCPQLISACLWAQVLPRIVDTAAGHWGYDLNLLRGACSRDTVAIVAVNLLGIGDQAQELLPLARASGAYLVQDSAQHLPTLPTGWNADYVVLSFGRGKPLNLLRGGALAFSEQQALLADAPVVGGRARLREAVLASRAAGAAFNFITHPRAYGLALRLPGLGLGETRYSPVAGVSRLPFATWGQLGAAYETYSRRHEAFRWDAVLPSWRRDLGVQELTLPGSAAAARDRRLRLALLAPDRAFRDRASAALAGLGLGASAMYGTAVDGIQNIPGEVSAQGPFANAAQLAERLFTLPTHDAVSDAVVAQTDGCLRKIASSGG